MWEAADRLSGEIEVFDGNNVFEGVGIKHNIPISLGLVEDAYQKIAQTPVSRYYLLQLFLENYSKNLQLDSKQKTDIKETHLRYWDTLLNPSY